MPDSFVENIRKTCKLCHTYRRFKPADTSNRRLVETELDALQKDYTQRFEELRRNPDSDDDAVTRAKQTKYFLMDQIQACQACDREEPRVSNALLQLK